MKYVLHMEKPGEKKNGKKRNFSGREEYIDCFDPD